MDPAEPDLLDQLLDASGNVDSGLEPGLARQFLVARELANAGLPQDPRSYIALKLSDRI